MTAPKIISAKDLRQHAKKSRDITVDYDRIIARLLMHMETTSENNGTQVLITLTTNSYTITFDDTDSVLDQEWYYENLKHLYGDEINKIVANLQNQFYPEGYTVTVFNERSSVVILISWRGNEDVPEDIKHNSSIINKVSTFFQRILS